MSQVEAMGSHLIISSIRGGVHCMSNRIKKLNVYQATKLIYVKISRLARRFI